MQPSNTTSPQAKRVPVALHGTTQLTTGTIRRYDERDASDTSDSESPRDSARDTTTESTSEDNGGRASKRARVDDGVPVGDGVPVDNGIPVDCIAPFPSDAVGEKYAVVKGVQPGIYDTV